VPAPKKKRSAASSPAGTGKTGGRARAKAKAGSSSRARKKSTTKAVKRTAAKPRPSARDEAAFNEALIASGQAARPDAQGKLPRGATHSIVEDDRGKVTVVRRRFSMA
jgi:hypothetical protein